MEVTDLTQLLVLIVLCLTAIILLIDLGSLLVKIGSYIADYRNMHNTKTNDKDDAVIKLAKFEETQQQELLERRSWKKSKDKYYVDKDPKIWEKNN